MQKLSRKISLLALILSLSPLLVLNGTASAATSKLLYLGFNGTDTTAIRTIYTNGTNDTLLKTDPTFLDGQDAVEWSPDGTKIAYTKSDSGGLTHNVHIMNADGTGDIAVTSDNISGTFGISWSPDSTKLAYTAYDTSISSLIIYSVHADGTNRTQLTTSTLDACPVWTSTNKIVFGSLRDANVEIYTMNADGSGQTNITNNGTGTDGIIGSFCALHASDDGSKIVFTTDRNSPGATYELYKMNIDGTGVTRLTTSNANATNMFAKWSHNGNKIVWGSNNNNLAGGFAGYQIYTMNADGSGQTQLTSSGANVKMSDTLFGGIEWSPDDTQIAFTSNRNGTPQIFTMNANGSSQTMVVSGYSYIPRWQPTTATNGSGSPGTNSTGTSGASSSGGSSATLANTGLNTDWIKVASAALIITGASMPILVRRVSSKVGRQ